MQELAPKRDRASVQQHPDARGTKLMPYISRVEYHDRHALSVEFGLAGVGLVHADLGDRGALGVGAITRDQLLQRIAHVLRQRRPGGGDLLGRLRAHRLSLALASSTGARALRGRLEGHP